jgi:hypothetical protein
VLTAVVMSCCTVCCNYNNRSARRCWKVYTMKYRRYKSSSYTHSSCSQHCQHSTVAALVHSRSRSSGSVLTTTTTTATPVAATTAAAAAHSCCSSRSSSACALTASTAKQACAGPCLLRTLHCCCYSALKLLLYCKRSTAAQRSVPTVL